MFKRLHIIFIIIFLLSISTSASAVTQILNTTFSNDRDILLIFKVDENWDSLYSVDDTGLVLDASSLTALETASTITCGGSNTGYGQYASSTTYYYKIAYATLGLQKGVASSEGTCVTGGSDDALSFSALTWPTDTDVTRALFYLSDTSGSNYNFYRHVPRDATTLVASRFPYGDFGTGDDKVAVPSSAEGQYLRATLANELVKDGTVEFKFTVAEASKDIRFAVRVNNLSGVPTNPQRYMETGIFIDCTGGTACSLTEIINNTTYLNPTNCTATPACADYDDQSEHTLKIVFDGNDLTAWFDGSQITVGDWDTANNLQAQTVNNQAGEILMQAKDVKLTISEITVEENDANYTDTYEWYNCNQMVNNYNYHYIDDTTETYWVPLKVFYRDMDLIRDEGFNIVSRKAVEKWRNDCTTNFLPPKPFMLEHSENGTDTALAEYFVIASSKGMLASIGADPYRLGVGSEDVITQADLQTFADAGMITHHDTELGAESTDYSLKSAHYTTALTKQYMYDHHYGMGSAIQDPDGWSLFPIGGNINACSYRADLTDNWQSLSFMNWMWCYGSPIGMSQYMAVNGSAIGYTPIVPTDEQNTNNPSKNIPLYREVDRLLGDYRHDQLDLSDFVKMSVVRTDTHLDYNSPQKKIMLDWVWNLRSEMTIDPTVDSVLWGEGNVVTDSAYKQIMSSGTLHQTSTGSNADEYRYWHNIIARPNLIFLETSLQVDTGVLTVPAKSSDTIYLRLIGSGYLSLGERGFSVYDDADSLKKAFTFDTKERFHKVGLMKNGTNFDLFVDGAYIDTYAGNWADNGSSVFTSHWEFNDDATDSNTTTGNDLTEVNSPTYTAGVYGNAIDFNGTDQRAFITDGNQTGLEDVEEFSFGGYFNRDRTATQEVLASKFEVAGDDSWMVFLQSADDTGRCLVKTNNRNGVTSTTTFTSTSTDYHIACVYNGVDLRLYVNGVEEGTPDGTYTGTVNNSTVDVTFGARSDDTSRFDGWLDDWFAVDKALTAGEITAIINNGAASVLGVEFGMTGGATAQEVVWDYVRLSNSSSDATTAGYRYDYGILGPITFLGNTADFKTLSWVEYLNGTGGIFAQARGCADETCTANETWYPTGGEVTVSTMDTGETCTEEDNGNTDCSFDTSIKNEGTASLKVTTTASSSNGDYIYVDSSAIDMTGKNLYIFDAYSDQTGCDKFKIMIGESATDTDTSVSKRICIDRANTWQTYYIDIDNVVSPVMVDAYFPMEEQEKRHDLSGTENNLAETSAVAQNASGKIDNSVTCTDDGTDTLSTSTALPCSAQDECTSTKWINHTATGAKEVYFDSDYLEIYVDASDQYVCDWDAATDTITSTTTATGGGTYDHVVCTYDNPGNAEVHVNNGGAEGSSATTAGTLATDATARFCEDESSTDATDATGSIDEVTFDNALWTSEQIAYFNNSGSGIDLKNIKTEMNMDAVTHFFVEVVDDTGSPTLWIDDVKVDAYFDDESGSDVSALAVNSPYFQVRFILTSTDKKRSSSMWDNFNLLFQGAALEITGGGASGVNPNIN